MVNKIPLLLEPTVELFERVQQPGWFRWNLVDKTTTTAFSRSLPGCIRPTSLKRNVGADSAAPLSPIIRMLPCDSFVDPPLLWPTRRPFIRVPCNNKMDNLPAPTITPNTKTGRLDPGCQFHFSGGTAIKVNYGQGINHGVLMAACTEVCLVSAVFLIYLQASVFAASAWKQ